MNRCLYCYKPLSITEMQMHKSCCKKFFGTVDMPTIDYTTKEIDDLAREIIEKQTSLTGVQPKLSLHLNEHDGAKRLTIVGLWGGYICKPQSSLFPMLPEIEDLTMHLAEASRIHVVPHTLMLMADNTLCYLSKRIDRTATGVKLPMEDMCQLTERLTEHKYKSSYERIGKAIKQFSSVPLMDVTDFFEVVLFSWITGNNDMHLKNFSLFMPDESSVRLTPAYDLLNAAIINPKDDEELALTLNGKKKKITRTDFLQAATTMGINLKTVEHFFTKYVKLIPSFETIVHESFLNEELKEKYKILLRSRSKQLE